MFTTVINTIPATISMPGIITGDGLHVSGGDSYCDPYITMDSDLIILWSMDIIKREISKLEDIDLKKFSTALTSKDHEIFDLFMSYITGRVIYADRLLYAIRDNNTYSIVSILKEYVNENKFNLTDEIR